MKCEPLMKAFHSLLTSLKRRRDFTGSLRRIESTTSWGTHRLLLLIRVLINSTTTARIYKAIPYSTKISNVDIVFFSFFFSDANEAQRLICVEFELKFIVTIFKNFTN